MRAGAAHAHVTLEQPKAPAGSTVKAVLRVGHGCDGSATHTLRVAHSGRLSRCQADAQGRLVARRPQGRAGATLREPRPPGHRRRGRSHLEGQQPRGLAGRCALRRIRRARSAARRSPARCGSRCSSSASAANGTGPTCRPRHLHPGPESRPRCCSKSRPARRRSFHCIDRPFGSHARALPRHEPSPPIEESAMRSTGRLRLAMLLLPLGIASSAHAACGSAVLHAAATTASRSARWDHVGWSADVRIESLTQTTLRSGTHTIDAERSHRTKKTLERPHGTTPTLVTTIERSFDMQLVARSCGCRWCARDHLHDLIDESTGALGRQRTAGSSPGSATCPLLARWQRHARRPRQQLGRHRRPRSCPPAASTSATTTACAPNARCSPAAAPPTWCSAWPGAACSAAADALNAQADLGAARCNSREQFKPGAPHRAGWPAGPHAFDPSDQRARCRSSVVDKARDSGEQGEPDNSGARPSCRCRPVSTWQSVRARHPVRLRAGARSYQRVNGIQLVPKTSFVLGYTDVILSCNLHKESSP